MDYCLQHIELCGANSFTECLFISRLSWLQPLMSKHQQPADIFLIAFSMTEEKHLMICLAARQQNTCLSIKGLPSILFTHGFVLLFLNHTRPLPCCSEDIQISSPPFADPKGQSLWGTGVGRKGRSEKKRVCMWKGVDRGGQGPGHRGE